MLLLLCLLSSPQHLHLCPVLLVLRSSLSHDNPGQGDRIEEAADTLMSIREEMTECLGYHLGLEIGVSEAGFSGGQHTGA